MKRKRLWGEQEIENYQRVDDAIQKGENEEIRLYMQQRQILHKNDYDFDQHDDDDDDDDDDDVKMTNNNNDNHERDDTKPINKIELEKIVQEMIKYDQTENGAWSENNGGLFTPLVSGDFQDITGRRYRDYNSFYYL